MIGRGDGKSLLTTYLNSAFLEYDMSIEKTMSGAELEWWIKHMRDYDVICLDDKRKCNKLGEM